MWIKGCENKYKPWFTQIYREQNIIVFCTMDLKVYTIVLLHSFHGDSLQKCGEDNKFSYSLFISLHLALAIFSFPSVSSPRKLNTRVFKINLSAQQLRPITLHRSATSAPSPSAAQPNTAPVFLLVSTDFSLCFFQ